MKVFGGCPSLLRNRTPTRPDLGLNSGPHAYQHSGRQYCHCTIESGQYVLYSLVGLDGDGFFGQPNKTGLEFFSRFWCMLNLALRTFRGMIKML